MLKNFLTIIVGILIGCMLSMIVMEIKYKKYKFLPESSGIIWLSGGIAIVIMFLLIYYTERIK